MMDPDSTVTRNEYIVDRLGNRREFDIVIRGEVSGISILGVIECKDWNKKIGTPQVEAFIQKARNVNANILAMVSRRGFTIQALRLAIHEGVGVYSLLPDNPIDEDETGFTVEIPAFATAWCWTAFRCELHLVSGSVVDGRSATYKDHPAMEWFLKELSTTYASHFELGDLRLDIRYYKPQTYGLNGTQLDVEKVVFEAARILKHKQRLVRFKGDAFLDWKLNKLSIPPLGRVDSEPLNTDFVGWDDWDGNPEDLTTGYNLRLNIYPIKPDTRVVNLVRRADAAE